MILSLFLRINFSDSRCVQVEMVVAAGGFDTSGTVKLYRCPAPDLPLGGNWDQSNGVVNGYLY